MPTETTGDVVQLFEEHRDEIELREKKREVVAFVPMDRLDYPKGLPSAFHELAEEHHIRIVDALALSADHPKNPTGEYVLGVHVWPSEKDPADHYHEHHDNVPEPA